MKTYTPTLDAAVLDRLRDYAATFAPDFPQAKPAAWAGVYLQGLLLDGDRKSIEPLSRRVRLPEGLTSKDPEQALQQFVNQSPWDERPVLRRYRTLLADTCASPEGIFLFDDVSLPKQGSHSVGVQRQYCGALGKRANCQVLVSVHYVSPQGHYPLDLRLYLPDRWLADPARLEKAGVPEPERRPLTKAQIALELLDRVRAEGLPGWAAVADAGYGVSGAFREGLAARLARPRLATGRLCRGRTGLAADRRAGRRQDQVRVLELASGHQLQAGGPPVEEPLAGGTGIPTIEGRARPGPLRGTFVAWPAPSRVHDPAGVWVSAVGAAARGATASQTPKKRGTEPVLTLPGIRRALQQLLLPLAKPDCTYCCSQRLHPIQV